MTNPATAIFSVWNLESRSTDDQGRGTAVAISGDLLVTCEHVVRDAEEVTLISHHPLFEGKNVMKGKVIGTDKNLDLALLRSSDCLPFSLELEGKEDLDDSIPLMIWSWPGWNAWWAACREKGIQAITPSTLIPAPRAAVMTNFWTEEENNTRQFSFAGRIEGGMSGGPVVSVLNNKITGIVTAEWNVDAESILASSYLDGDSCLDEESQRWFERIGERMRAAVIAQLDLGMGIAIGLKGLKAFLDTKASSAL